MERKYLFGILALLAIGFVTAAYAVTSFTITANVLEPFEINYVILGGSTDIAACQTEGLVWAETDDLALPGLYPGESRIICLRVNNSAPVELAFELSSNVNTTNDNLADCEYALGTVTLEDDVAANTVYINGTVVTIPTDAIAAEGCELELTVLRN